MIKAVIYDVDGTLIDSEPIHMAAWNVVLEEHGHTLRDAFPDFLTQMAGKKPIIIATEMVAQLALPIEPQRFMEKKMEIFKIESERELIQMPGAVDSIKAFYDEGYRLAIGTSLDREFLDIILTKLGVADLFEVIVTGDQIKHGKPDPETYTKAIEKLGLQPHECVVFEDAPNGVAAAKAAGAWCIAIGDAPGADRNVASFYEVDDILLSELK